MNIRDLHYLIALADLRHFGKAAQACFVSQPALSMQIKKLEKTLGVQLLERTNKSVVLTECGNIIAERARQIISQVAEIKEIAKLSQDPFSGELKIGVFPTLAPYLLPWIVPPLSQAYPNLSFYLVEEQTQSLIEKLKQGKIHAALLALPILEKNFSCSPLFEEEFLLAVPHQHPLATCKWVSEDDLQTQTILLLEEGHCLRDQALALCHKLSATEMQDFRATSLETLRHMVSAGVGITLMPKLACHPQETIRYVPFKGPKPVRSIALVWRSSSAKHLVLEQLTKKIKTILTKQPNVKILSDKTIA